MRCDVISNNVIKQCQQSTVSDSPFRIEFPSTGVLVGFSSPRYKNRSSVSPWHGRCKRRLKWGCPEITIKRLAPCQCLDGHIQEPYEMSKAFGALSSLAKVLICFSLIPLGGFRQVFKAPYTVTQVAVFLEKQDGRPGLWFAETFLTSLKPLNQIQWSFTGSKISTSSTKFVFFGLIWKTGWLPWPLIGWDIFDFSSETADQNSRKIDKKQDLNVLYQVCVFGPIGKTRWPPLPLIGWDIYDFSSETTERNLWKLDRKQDLNILYKVNVVTSLWRFYLSDNLYDMPRLAPRMNVLKMYS